MNNPMSAVPAQPVDITPTVQNDWMRQVNLAFNEWAERYISAARFAGFGVVIVDDGRSTVTSVYQTGAYVVIQLVRQGVSADILLSLGRAYGRAPEDQFQHDATTIWAVNYAMQTGDRIPASGMVPLETAGPPSTLAQTGVIYPGPAGTDLGRAGRDPEPTTVSGGGIRFGLNPASTPTAPEGSGVNWTGIQSGSAPDPGTLISDPAPAVERLNWDQWNYVYEQETGRIGFAPEAAGVSDRRALMTRAEWWALARPLYEGSGSGSGGNDQPPAAPPAAPAVGAFTLIGALLELLMGGWQ